MKSNLKDLTYTGRGDRESEKNNVHNNTSKLVDEIQNKAFNEIDSQGQRNEKINIHRT